MASIGNQSSFDGSTLCYCANLKAIRYESTSLNRIVSDKFHRVIVALVRRSIAKFLNSTAGIILMWFC